METRNLVTVNDFCTLYYVEYDFISSLESVGLVQVIKRGEEKFIDHNQLAQLEKIIRLTRDLDVNIAGIEVIINLLQRMEEMQQELTSLRNRLSFYESSKS